MKHVKRVRFASKMVVVSALAITLFTFGIFLLEFANIEAKTNIQVPAELIAAWYAFWTVEIVSLATIRVSKIRNKYEASEGE